MSSPWSPPEPAYTGEQVPTAVLVSALVTGIVSTVTLMMIALMSLVLAPAFNGLLEAFGVEHGTEWLVGVVATLGLMCVGAIVLAILVTRRSNPARWALVVLSAVTAAVAAVAALTIVVPVVNAVAAIVVAVLLLLPETGRWYTAR